MKKLYFLLLLSFSGFISFAAHITGGEMYYTLLSQSGNSYTYRVTLKLYRDFFSTGAQLDASAAISVYNNSTNATVQAFPAVSQAQIVPLQLTTPSPCIQNPPTVYYQVGYYTFDVTLDGSPLGYTIAYQRCCRIAGINNLVNSGNVGATYTAQIPGTGALANAPANNSAHFIGADTVIVCANNQFCYNFGAVDPDQGDSLGYSFCSAYTGASTANPAPNPPANPPYGFVPYNAPFSDQSPLGNGVTLDPRTGMLCGIAPAAGIYVVTVCVTEYRQGIAIATQRKDLQIKIGDCSIASAELKPDYSSCDGFTFPFSNESPPSTLIHSYFWDFGDGNTSTLSNPVHTFADTGTYTFKLVINRGEECRDSATARIHVYPGFFPGFTFSGVCTNKPTQFTDTSHTRYGFIDSWNWNFGDLSTSADTSHLRNPAYTYSQTGTKHVQFIVTSNKGCIDTIDKDVIIMDKPPLNVSFKDTLICRPDSIQLQANGSGSFSWTPLVNIINPNTSTPTVFPTTTTKYIVQLNDQGCIANDTVQVRVVNFVSLTPKPDTIICATDTIRLGASTNGLKFSWTPVASLSDPTLLNPFAIPTATTTYQLKASIGTCSATASYKVILVPYPVAKVSGDTSICFNTSAQLHATITGTSFSWAPITTLTNANTLDPIATPKVTTTYILTVFDIVGCPKPGRDTVLVTVFPKVFAFAGRDTSVVIGQPLQFNGTGGDDYLWSPGIGLNHIDIYNPIGLYDGSFDSIKYKLLVTDKNGCMDTDYVVVRVFKTKPEIFIPSAFTPNGDGNNDVFRPIAAGIKNIEYFRVFNRWGQLVFSTTINGQGWDGRINGKAQGSGTFVWVVKAVDYTGKEYFSKGTVTLIK
jgi:gliding motility-associated-like protein